MRITATGKWPIELSDGLKIIYLPKDMYRPFSSFFNSIAKVVKDLSSPSSEKPCSHATKDGKKAIP